MGWIGSKQELMNVLAVHGADKDEEGNYLVYVDPPVSFLGMGEEFVVSDKTEISYKGKRINLAYLLGQTSYGLKVNVI